MLAPMHRAAGAGAFRGVADGAQHLVSRREPSLAYLRERGCPGSSPVFGAVSSYVVELEEALREPCFAQMTSNAVASVAAVRLHDGVARLRATEPIFLRAFRASAPSLDGRIGAAVPAYATIHALTIILVPLFTAVQTCSIRRIFQRFATTAHWTVSVRLLYSPVFSCGGISFIAALLACCSSRTTWPTAAIDALAIQLPLLPQVLLGAELFPSFRNLDSARGTLHPVLGFLRVSAVDTPAFRLALVVPFFRL